MQDRAYGCPSIRTDLPQATGTRRSLADSQNFGNDPVARDLICPPAFSDLSIPETAMSDLRSRTKLFEVFGKIGYADLLQQKPDVADAIFYEAARGKDSASINSFRNCLNEYLIAVDEHNEDQWLFERGL